MKRICVTALVVWAALTTNVRADDAPTPAELRAHALQKNRLWIERAKIRSALAGPSSKRKLSVIAVDPYAILALGECARAIPDVDYDQLKRTRFASPEARLVTAARSSAHRRALTEMIDVLIAENRVPPNAKVDPEAHAQSVRTAFTEWVSVLPDDDVELLRTLLKPKIAKTWGAERFVKELDDLLKLLDR